MKSIIFDGINLYDTYKLVNVTEEEFPTKNFGVVNTVIYNAKGDTFVEATNDRQIKELIFVKEDIKGVANKISDDELNVLKQLFFTKKEHVLQIDDVIYYGLVASAYIQPYRNSNYFVISFECGVGYSVIKKIFFNTSEEPQTITITNNGIEDIYADVEINGNGKLTIKNIQNELSAEFTINNEEAKLIGDFGEMINCSSDKLINVRELLKLSVGENNFTIKSSENALSGVIVKFVYQEIVGDK